MSVSIVPAVSARARPELVRTMADLAARRGVVEGRTRAVSVLPFLDPAAALQALPRIAADRTEEKRIRRLAVDALARVADPGAVDALASIAAARDDVAVLEAVAVALGRRGRREHLEVIRARIPDSTGVARASLAFAASVIAHRFDVAGFDPPRASAANLDSKPRAERADVRTPAADELETARRTLAEAAPGMAVEGPALEVDCAGRRQMLVVTTEAAEAVREPALLLRRRWHVAQLAYRNPSNGRYSPGLSVLTTPTSGGVEVGLYRSDGTLVFGGTGAMDGDRFVARLRAASRPGALGTTAEVTVTPGRLDIRITSDTAPAVEPKRPQPDGA
jgi:hypothetical protein